MRPKTVSAATLALVAIVAIVMPAHASVNDNLRTVVGDIAAVNADAKVITIDIGLKQVEIAYTDETKIKGGELEAGKSVRISTTAGEDGQRVATNIKVRG